MLKMNKMKKKTAVIITAAAVLVLVPATAAFAYWSVGGTGTGTATTGTSTDLTVVQTPLEGDLYPGGPALQLSGVFNNLSEGPVYVATVRADITSVTMASGVVGVCAPSDYTLANAVMTVDAEIAKGANRGLWSGASIAFNDKPLVNQDACKGATVNLSYTIAPD